MVYKILVVHLILFCKIVTALPQDGDAESVCSGSIPEVEELPVRENLAGKWISTECETRPGGKFVLRSYEFRENLTFSLDLHRYRDEWCSTSMYSARALGAMTEDSFVIFEVKVIPHTTLVARDLQQKVNEACPGFATRQWRANREYSLQGGRHRPSLPNTNYQTAKRSRSHHHIDCSHALGLEFSELTTIRVQKFQQKLELLTADISDPQSRNIRGHQVPMMKVYENKPIKGATQDTLKNPGPSLSPGSILLGFFEPDVPSTSAESSVFSQDMIMRSRKRNVSTNTNGYRKLFRNCAICEIISKSTIASPPYLPTRPQLPVYLTGHWTSRRCESHPQGGYTLRSFEFREQTRRFHAKIRYYEDDLCRIHLYTLQLRGEYYLGMFNDLLHGSTDVDFYTHRTIITIHNSALLDSVNERLRGILDGRRPKIQDFRQQFYAFQSVFSTRNVKYCDEDLYELDVPKVHARTNCKIFGLENAFFEKNVLKLEVDIYGTTLLSMGKLSVTFADDIINDIDNYRTMGYGFNPVADRASSYGSPLEHCESIEADLEKQFVAISSANGLNFNFLVILVSAVMLFY